MARHQAEPGFFVAPVHRIPGSWPRLLCALIACCGLMQQVNAQAAKLGSYSGSIKVSENLDLPNQKRKTQVSAKIVLPVSQRDADGIYAEFLAGEAPHAKLTVTQWDTFKREASADSGGQFNTTSCSLAKPTEVAATVTGVVQANTRTKKQSLSITLLSTAELPFNCTHSRSSDFKKTMPVSVYAGTGAPGSQDKYARPLVDPAQLAGRFTLEPSDSKGEAGQLVQEWDLRLSR